MGRRKYKGPLLGPFFLNIYKPVGITSFTVISKLKKILPLSIGKIGHFGTLDPFAEGVLLIGIGPATRFNIHSQKFKKEYIVEGVLGIGSPTGDIDIDENLLTQDESFNFEDLSFQQVKKSLEGFLGEYHQAPHPYSSAKYLGKPLYKWAREGINIEKDPVLRHIYEIELLKINQSIITFRVVVSSGTYIRVLFEDFFK